ncbi:hypothetical protein STEG23_004980 [Scotinomys teguina]
MTTQMSSDSVHCALEHHLPITAFQIENHGLCSELPERTAQRKESESTLWETKLLKHKSTSDKIMNIKETPNGVYVLCGKT